MKIHMIVLLIIAGIGGVCFAQTMPDSGPSAESEPSSMENMASTGIESPYLGNEDNGGDSNEENTDISNESNSENNGEDNNGY